WCSAWMEFSPSATMAASLSAYAISIRPRASASSDSSARTEDTDASSFWRSRIIFWASWGTFQMAGSSALAFSSARRRVDLSQSKMPPQQGERLLDLFDGALDFGTHGEFSGRSYRQRPAVRKVRPFSRARHCWDRPP